MTTENQQEQWQVEVGGKIYEAVMGELPDWINEGSLLPGDKIRKGNLRWIEARKVPALVPFFNAKEKGEPLPVVQTYTQAASEIALPAEEAFNDTPSPASPYVAAEPPPATTQAPFGDACSVHSDAPAFYICSGCENLFCKGCPSSYGGNVKICPSCGSMCSPAVQVNESNKRSTAMAASAAQGFGIGDFISALSHPFKFKASLILGGAMFMFFSLGRSASAVGGIFMIVAAIFCAMLANTLTFGVLANTIDNFSKGDLEADFMPRFDEFSLWDDVVHPFFLSIGAYVSSFGPFILVAVIGAYMVISSAGAQMKKFESEISQVPGTEYYQPDRTAEQSQEVKDLLAKIKQQNDRRLEQQARAADGDTTPVTDDGAQNMDKLLQQTQATPVEKKPNLTEQQYTALISSLLRLAAPLVIFGLITFLWGLFYFPAACAVAGYTRSFTATLNPTVGLDTIKRLGVDYVKILLMCLCIVIASALITGFLAVIFAPLDLPRMGNIPAKVIGSFFSFYFSIVFSCILGLALFKSADKLKLLR